MQITSRKPWERKSSNLRGFPRFVLICSESKSEQIGRKRSKSGYPENKERKSEQIGRKQRNRNKSEQIRVTDPVTHFCRPRIGRCTALGNSRRPPQSRVEPSESSKKTQFSSERLAEGCAAGMVTIRNFRIFDVLN